ncbi:MAG: hypothetical protein ACQEVA_12410 [Myxococcota bacterium]
MRYPTYIMMLLVGGALTFIGCDKPREPAPSADEELMRQLEERARNQPPRASISFGFTHELEDIEEGGPIELEADEGTSIRIEGAWLVVSALEAHLCEPKLARSKGTWLDRAGDLVVPSAQAHVPSSATRLGVPFVEDLLGRAGKASIVGEVAPPVGEYCTFYAVVSPADDDVLNLTELPTSEVEGKSLVLEGTIASDDGEESFVSTSSRRDVVQFPAIDPNTGVEPLALETPQTTQMILLQKTVSPELFEGISPESFESSEAADTVLDRLEPTFRVKRFN